jgi:predicted transcriptional regulator
MSDLESTKDVVENLFKDISETEAVDESGLTSLQLRDIMDTKFVVLHPQTDIRETLNIFVRDDMHDAPVVDDKTIVGMVRTQDIWQALEERFMAKGADVDIAEFKETMQDICTVSVSEIMNEAISVGVEDTLLDALVVMDEEDINTLPVVKDNELIGVVRDQEVMRVLLKSLFSD